MASDPDNFDINENTYDWCVRTFHAYHNKLALNIKVHHNDGLTEQGDIFLFNHFARFETIIPHYIIHQATGDYCRAVADHRLLDGNERISSFLRSLGVVPNNMPGLLPFLAAEILRGRKVVFFPEGGMVKDRKVMNDEGDFSVYSQTAKARRKHHRGAAVLALTLEIFKSRILTLEKRGDTARIERWVKSLGLPSEAALLKAARKPTTVIPGTITFYPLRVGANAFSRTAEFLSKGMRENFFEELVIEGNLLLKDTDMDIRLGQPLTPDKKWHWWERLMLERYFRKIRSLDELFDLHEQEDASLPDKFLARCITQEIDNVRDRAMKELYTGITVNLSHLASYLIFRLVKQGRMSIDLSTFNKTLYLALKNLQAVRDVHLHRSLYWPDRYRGLLDGHSPEFNRFLNMAKSTGLVGKTNRSYHFLTPLVDDFGFDQVRINNPLQVYANEAAPLSGMRETVDKALLDAPHISEQELASFLFDDELRAQDWNRRHFDQPKYSEINNKEAATKSGAPYLLLPKDKHKIGVLLVHGLLSSPAQWQEYADTLCARGIAVMGVRLAGHGTSPWDLHNRKGADWSASVERGYRILSAFAEKVVVIGFSAGGSLALINAAKWPKGLAGTVCINGAVEFRDRKMAFIPLIHSINKVAHWLPMIDEVMPFRDNSSETPLINYASIPIPALFELRLMIEEMQRRLPDIQSPVLVIQSENDQVVHPDSAKSIVGKIATDCMMRWVPSHRHSVICDNEDGVWDTLDNFIDRVTGVQTVSPQNVSQNKPQIMEVLS